MQKRTSKGPSDVDRVIGLRVRQLRLQMGMSQEELGKEVGLTFQQIQKYEKGTNRLSVSRMLQFTSILQTTPNDIVGWQARQEPALNNFNNSVFEAAREFAALPEELQIVTRKVCSALTVAMMKKKQRKGVD